MRLRSLLLAAVLALLAPVAARAAGTPPVGKLTWLGQACFVLETAAGTRVVMDPIPKGLGYELPSNLRADLVTISHEHADHNNVALVAGKPRVIRGLTSDRKGWTRVDEKVKDVSVRAVAVYHDDKRGAVRGLNTVFIFEVGGLRIAHLGDLGNTLTDEQLAAIGLVDVLLIPVGGTFTIDGRQATRVVEQLRPRVMVVPDALQDGRRDDQGAGAAGAVPRRQGERPPREDADGRAVAAQGAARRRDSGVTSPLTGHRIAADGPLADRRGDVVAARDDQLERLLRRHVQPDAAGRRHEIQAAAGRVGRAGHEHARQPRIAFDRVAAGEAEDAAAPGVVGHHDDVREDPLLRVGERDVFPRAVQVAQAGHPAQERSVLPIRKRPTMLVTNTPIT